MNKDTLLLITNIHNYFFCREKRRREEEDAEDPRVRIDLFSKPRYNPTTIAFFFATKYNKQVNESVQCRDYLNDCFRQALHDKNGSYWRPGYHKPELDELRLVMWSSALDDQKIRTGLRVVNMYAKLAGWSETKVYPSKMENQVGEWLNAYLLVGPKEWQRYPQLLSLFILFFRLAKIITIPEYIKDPYALECFWQEVVKLERGRIGNGNSMREDISTFLFTCYEKLIVLMKNEKKIFGGGLEKAWPQSCISKTGIHSMCESLSVHPGADAKLQKFYSAEMEKHPKCWR